MTSSNREYAPLDPSLARLIRGPIAADHKYSRGVLGMVVGSAGYPGAALLVASAALRTGIGMARLVSVDAVAELVLAARPEVVRGSVADRCDAWVLGCGVAVEPASAEASWIAAVSGAAHEVGVPMVIDAGALQLVEIADFGPHAILTPHHGEAVRLLARYDVVATAADLESDSIGAAQQLANLTGSVVVLKGSRTVVAAPGDVFWRNHEAPAGLASAGTGDVLAGIIGALAAAGYAQSRANGDAPTVDPFEVARLGVWLHSQAAFELATEGTYLAGDMVERMRSLIGRLAQ